MNPFEVITDKEPEEKATRALETVKKESEKQEHFIEKPEFISHSTVTSFIEYRPSWYQTKILGHDFMSTDYFEKGKAIEEGIRVALETDGDFEKAVKVATEKLKEGASTLSSTYQQKALDNIPDLEEYLKVGFKQLSSYGKLEDRKDSRWTKYGVRIEYKHPRIPISLYGFLDFLFKSTVVDTKVLGRKPSKLSQSYLMQGIVYQYGTGFPVCFEALTKSKSKGVECTAHWVNKDNRKDYYEEYLIAACNALISVYDALDEGNTEKLMLAMSFPDLSSIINVDEKKAAYEEFVTNCPFAPKTNTNQPELPI